MASNTIKVVDGTGVQLLEQLNLINPALASMQYGSTDPSVGGYAVSGMWWADTGNNLVKQRNSANTAWITQGTVDSNGAITWNNANSAVSATTATTATSATKDGNGKVIASTYVPLSGGTLTGAINLANNTWNVLGDDVMIGDCNINGCMGIKGNNATTGIAMYQYASSSNYATLKYDGTNFIPSVPINGTCDNANKLSGYTYSQIISNAQSLIASSIGSSNGYVKFSNGFMIQYVTCTKPSGGSYESVTVNFPKAFSSWSLPVGYIPISGGSSETQYNVAQIWAHSTTSFQLTAWCNESITVGALFVGV